MVIMSSNSSKFYGILDSYLKKVDYFFSSKPFISSKMLVIYIVATDALVKYLVLFFQPSSFFPPFGYVSLVRNTGTAFGLFQNTNALWIVISLLIILGLVGFSISFPKETGYQLAFGLILGGAIGNLIDRIVYGAVIDYVSLVGIPTFNVADACITFGGIILFFLVVRK